MEQLKEFEVIYVVGARPSDVPEEWVIFNAPRPLYGQLVWEDTDAPCGWFHAAVYLNGERGPTWVVSNKRMDARVLFYISYQEFKGMVSEYANHKKKEYADRTLDSITYQEWEDTYLMQDDHPRIWFRADGAKERKHGNAKS